MKRTEFKFIARTVNGYPVYRKVWVNEKGEYFIKDEGGLHNVTFAKNDFIKES